MTSMARFRRALSTTFGIHVLQTLLALLAASVWTAGFVAAFRGHPEGVDALRAGGPIAVESIGSFLKTHSVWAIGYTGAVALGWWLVSIPLQMTWLRAHDTPLDRVQLKLALRRSIPALGASLLMLLPLTLVVATLIGVPWGWVALYDEPDPRVHDVGLLLASLPGVLLLLSWAAWQDVARAAVSVGLGPLEAMRAGWRMRAAHLYLGWWLVGFALSLTGIALGGPAWWMLLVAQLAWLARTYARSAWWSCALTRVHAFVDPSPRERNHVRK